MDDTVRRLGNPSFHVSALVARWRAATQTFTWVNCGHAPPYLADPSGNLTELDSPPHPALGASEPGQQFAATQRELHSDERIILVTDGITGRRMEGGGRFGADGIAEAIAGLAHPTAAATAMAVLQAVTDCWREPLEDDGTVAVLAIE